MNSKRKIKGNTEKIFLMSSIYDSKNDEWNFEVKNSTVYNYSNIDKDRYYKLKVSNTKAQCNCMDYKMRQHKQDNLCKHLYFIINRVCNNLGYEHLTTICDNFISVKERINIRIKKVLEDKDVINIDDNKTNDINNELINICKEEEYCSICYDDFDYEHINENSVKICLSQCKKPYHTDCIRMWLARNKNCPLCRSYWINENNNEISNDPFCHLNNNTIKI